MHRARRVPRLRARSSGPCRSVGRDTVAASQGDATGGASVGGAPSGALHKSLGLSPRRDSSMARPWHTWHSRRRSSGFTQSHTRRSRYLCAPVRTPTNGRKRACKAPYPSSILGAASNKSPRHQGCACSRRASTSRPRRENDADFSWRRMYESGSSFTPWLRYLLDTFRRGSGTWATLAPVPALHLRA